MNIWRGSHSRNRPALKLTVKVGMIFGYEKKDIFEVLNIQMNDIFIL